jgi:hypothetical protein
VNKYSKELKELLPGVQFSKVSLPKDEDINGFYVAHNAEALQFIINERKFLFSFSVENKSSQPENKIHIPKTENPKLETPNSKLNVQQTPNNCIIIRLNC